MNEVIAVMLDVSKLVAGGSDATRIEVRRTAAERERRAVANAQSLSDQPVAAIAQATERTRLRSRS